MTPFELLALHARAMFTMDAAGRPIGVNEPWSNGAAKPAPLLYLGITADKAPLLYTRFDVDDQLALKAKQLTDQGVLCAGVYEALLNAPVAARELCYSLPNGQPAAKNCVALTLHTIDRYALGEFEWLRGEIKDAQPCHGYIVDGLVTSICRSVRIDQVHEAGIETAPAFRGRGYALEVLHAWAAAVRKLGAIPLYSTHDTNLASQRLAKKAGLIQYATGFSIEEKT